MTKTVRSRYTLEFKQEAVRLVQSGQSMAAAGRSLGVAEQTLFNWVKASRQGRLTGADSKPVSAEQMEIARLRAGSAAPIPRRCHGCTSARFTPMRFSSNLR